MLDQGVVAIYVDNTAVVLLSVGIGVVVVVVCTSVVVICAGVTLLLLVSAGV